MDNPLFEMTHTRAEYPAQRQRMEECARLGICPFCWEHLAKYHDAPILMKGTFWIITANDHPYDKHAHHYLAIYKDHINSISEVDRVAGAELFMLFNDLCQQKNIPGATMFMRFGDMKFNGATVYHLHAQIFSGASRDMITEPDKMDNWVMAKIGYKVL